MWTAGIRFTRVFGFAASWALIGWLAPSGLQASVQTPITSGTLTVHYNPNAAGETPSNIAWLEISNAILGGSTPSTLPDPFNYGFNLAIPSLTTATVPGLADYTANALTTLDLGINPISEFGPHGGLPAVWTIDYYSPENGQPVSDSSRSRAHTVQFGSLVSLTQTFDPANDGTGGIPDIQYVSGRLSVDDGIYHSINNPEFLNNDPLVLAAFGPGDYNLIDFNATLTERNDGISDDGLNFWDGSGSLVAGVPEPESLITFAALMLLGLTGLFLKRREGVLVGSSQMRCDR